MKKTFSTLFLLAFSALVAIAEPTFVLHHGRESAIYKSGEKISFELESRYAWFATNLVVEWSFAADGCEKQVGVISNSILPRTSLEFTAGNVPGWGLLTLSVFETNDKNRRMLTQKLAGVMIDPDKILPGTENPADFDEFWRTQIAEMARTSKVLRCEKVESVPTQDIYDVILEAGLANSAITNSAVNTAVLIMGKPRNAAPKSLPAIVQFHGASTYALRIPSQMYYADSAIHITLNPHSATNNADSAKYFTDFLEGYPRRNAEDRNEYYMKNMILRVVRALQFAKQQPEWNGEVLITHGESQGGFQSLVGAALDPDVTFCLAMVPAMSDHLGYLRQRRNGWPNVITPSVLRDELRQQQMNKALPYYDNANFARRIKCETWISTGFVDVTCPPSSVYAVFNSLPGDNENKHFHYERDLGHGAGCRPVISRLVELLGK